MHGKSPVATVGRCNANSVDGESYGELCIFHFAGVNIESIDCMERYNGKTENRKRAIAEAASSQRAFGIDFVVMQAEGTNWANVKIDGTVTHWVAGNRHGPCAVE